MVVLESVADLAWAANLAALELHVPQWQVDDDGVPQLPDLLVLDLDPGPETGLAECCAVAERLGERLEADGLDPVVKTSGSKGMQVYAPIECRPTASTPAGTPGRWRRSSPPRRRTTWSGGWRRCCARARCSSTGARTTRRRPPWRRTRCGPGPARRCPRRSAGTRWTRCATGADPATLRFTTDDVLARVEEYGDLFDVADAAPGAAARGLSRSSPRPGVGAGAIGGRAMIVGRVCGGFPPRPPALRRRRPARRPLPRPARDRRRPLRGCSPTSGRTSPTRSSTRRTRSAAPSRSGWSSCWPTWPPTGSTWRAR